MVIFVGLRIYTRLRHKTPLGTDDYLCLVSAATNATQCALILAVVDKPLGRNAWDVPIGEALTNNYWFEVMFASIIFFTLGSIFTKLTLLTLYLRIFKPKVWARRRSQCVNITPPLSKLQGWYGLVLDVYIAAAPIPLLWGLKLKLKQKLAVTAVFMTGSIAIGISALSLAQRYEAFSEGPKGAWDRGLQFFYGFLELSIGLTCSCMPVTAVTLTSFITRMSTL
ncbi:hypothetical protein BJ166DRAFT_594911 [Pestalotiopsis sp. NC0098]|nr:hypothetical protein BJ166DRAFT_594911 [Pestalotiopsis sp. NC0098]